MDGVVIELEYSFSSSSAIRHSVASNNESHKQPPGLFITTPTSSHSEDSEAPIMSTVHKIAQEGFGLGTNELYDRYVSADIIFSVLWRWRRLNQGIGFSGLARRIRLWCLHTSTKS